MMLSWEYPPNKIGGIAEHVYGLSKVLTRKEQEVHVVTLGDHSYEENEGVCLHRIAIDGSTPDFITRMNEEMEKIGASIIESTGIDIVHAHDWMVGSSAINLAFRYRKPLVSTIHSTEFGRSFGMKEEYQMRIHEIEEILVRLSDHVIVCSESMRKEIEGLFDAKRISIIPNGIDVSKFDFSVDREMIKERFCGSKSSKMILFIGRLVYQKGMNVLIGAMPLILSHLGDVKLVIVGEGPMREQLERDAAYFDLSKNVIFTGYLDDYTVRSLLKSVDVVVVPSLYEPFGIVALEAMAAKSPVVVSDTGGLSEIISGEEGIKVPPDNFEMLAEAILKILSGDSERMARAGLKKAISFDWNKITDTTIKLYSEVIRSYKKDTLLEEGYSRVDLSIKPWEYS
jgi:glycosyltransferase involved in cell wall biosynthesis